jgi:Flp pilus assembly pilin Flp
LPHQLHEIVRRTGVSEEGQTMTEYAVILGVITLAIVTTIGLISGALSGVFNGVAGLFS